MAGQQVCDGPPVFPVNLKSISLPITPMIPGHFPYIRASEGLPDTASEPTARDRDL
jgi:hypothetical protein